MTYSTTFLSRVTIGKPSFDSLLMINTLGCKQYGSFTDTSVITIFAGPGCPTSLKKMSSISLDLLKLKLNLKFCLFYLYGRRPCIYWMNAWHLWILSKQVRVKCNELLLVLLQTSKTVAPWFFSMVETLAYVNFDTPAPMRRI